MAESSLRDECTDCTIYQALSNHEKNPQFKDALKTLADTVRAHYEFWKPYAARGQGHQRRMILARQSHEH